MELYQPLRCRERHLRVKPTTQRCCWCMVQWKKHTITVMLTMFTTWWYCWTTRCSRGDFGTHFESCCGITGLRWRWSSCWTRRPWGGARVWRAGEAWPADAQHRSGCQTSWRPQSRPGGPGCSSEIRSKERGGGPGPGWPGLLGKLGECASHKGGHWKKVTKGKP